MKDVLILGADVSKGYCDFILLDAQKHVLEPRFRFDDTAKGHDQLRHYIGVWKRRYKASRILLVTESTGGYEDNWLRLATHSSVSGYLEAYRINAKLTYHEYQSQGRSSIDDGVSALTIAEHVAKNLEKFTPCRIAKETPYTAARSLITHWTSLDRACTCQKNALAKLTYQYLPSLEALRPDGWPAYWVDMLSQYGSRKSIQMAANKGFKQLKRVPQGKAEAIGTALAQGIDLRETPPMVRFSIQSKAGQIQQLEQEISRIEKHIIDQAPVDPEQVELLRSIKGMGPMTAVVLLCYIEDVHRFADAKKMAAFFGVQPRAKSSGDGGYKTKMSKQGASIVRRELYLLAFRTLQHEPYFKAIYAEARANGMAHDAALGKLMHKLTRIIFGILKNGKPFNAGIDRLNQKDNRPLAKKTKAKKTPEAERFQPPSTKAPVSRKKRKERKKDHEPQAVKKTESAGST
jgi:transposase